jgi:hypothetical protein
MRGQRWDQGGRLGGAARWWIGDSSKSQQGGRVAGVKGGVAQAARTCVCMSLPVTMLPTVRSAGTSTAGELCLLHDGGRASFSTQGVLRTAGGDGLLTPERGVATNMVWKQHCWRARQQARHEGRARLMLSAAG